MVFNNALKFENTKVMAYTIIVSVLKHTSWRHVGKCKWEVLFDRFISELRTLCPQEWNLDGSSRAGLFVVTKRKVIAPGRNVKLGKLRYHSGERRQLIRSRDRRPGAHWNSINLNTCTKKGAGMIRA
jgi:hypothetical protein